MNENKAKQTAALYWEACFLRRLLQMGLIGQEAFEGICRIAAEDYGTTLPLATARLCLK